MKKLWIPLVVLVVLGGGAFLFLERGVRAAVEEGGEYALGVETRLADVQLGLFDGRIALGELAIANPAGFPSDRLLSIGSIEAEAPLRNLLSDVVDVPRIALDDVDFRLDVEGLATNVDAVLEHLEEVLGPSDDGGDEPSGPGDRRGPSKRFRIGELAIGGVHTEIGLGPQRLVLDLPPIVLRDFDTSELGLTLPDLAAVLMRVLVDSSVAAGGDALPPDVLTSLKAATDRLASDLAVDLGLDLDALAEEASVVGGALEDALGPKATDRAKEAIGRGLDDLLGGDE